MSESDHDWRAEYPKYAKYYTPEEWEEYNTNPVEWCIKALASDDPDVRFNAVDILRGLCPDAENAITPIAKALTDSSPGVRSQAAFALIDFGRHFKGKAAAAIDSLVIALGDDDPETRSLAAQAIGAIGTPSVNALAALTTLESDSDDEVRNAALHAIESIGRA
jgi:HEAT repeat protein